MRNFTEREAELKDALSREKDKNVHNLRVIRGLRAYARALKALGEDWAPIGEPLPELLTMSPPILIEDESLNSNREHKEENEKLKLKVEDLENELRLI